MAAKKRNVEIEVLVDDKKAKAGLKGLGDESQKTGKRFSDTAKVIGAAMVAGAGVAVGRFVASSVDSFKNLNESLNAVNVTFGDSAEEVKSLGKEAARSVGLSNAEFNSLAVQMSSFAQTIAGDSGDVAGTVDELTTRIADFASVMNIDVAEAARLFQSGLAGETEPLRKFGIDLSAASVTAHGLAMGLGDASGQLSEQEKILARYDKLMGDTNKTAGDFANTSDELANATRITAAEMENQKAVMGETLAPAWEQMIGLAGEAAKAIGLAALAIGEFTGAFTPAEAAAKRLSTLLGEDTSSAEGFLTALVDLNPELDNTSIRAMQAATNTEAFETNLRELLDASGMTADEIRRLRDADDEFLLSLGFTIDQVEVLRDLLQRKLVVAQHDAMDAARHHKRALEEQEGATDDTTEAIQSYMDKLREAADPVFAAMQAADKLRDAQANLIEVQEDTEASADDLAEAELAVAEALFDAQGSMDALDPGALNAAIDAIATALGKSKDEVILLLEQLGILDGKTVTTFIDTVHRTKAQGTGGGVAEFHHGGVVPGPAGSEQLAVLQAGETVLPTHKPGHRGMGPTINVYTTAMGVHAIREAERYSAYLLSLGG